MIIMDIVNINNSIKVGIIIDVILVEIGVLGVMNVECFINKCRKCC